MRKMLVCSICFCLVFPAFSPPAGSNDYKISQGNACNSKAGRADKTLWNLWKCNDDSVTSYRRRLHIEMKEWAGWGMEAPFDIDKPFAKVLNSLFLLRNGLSASPQKWHYASDYIAMGQGEYCSSHLGFRYLPSTETSWMAFVVPEVYKAYLGCLLFQDGSPMNNPVTRAGDFVHEGLHMWEFTYFTDYRHMNGPIGHCTEYGESCDWFYYHTITDFPKGYLWMWGKSLDGKRQLFHSSNQLQMEFLCDLAEFPADWVPANIRILAEVEANHRLETRFRNVVAYRCGDPRPW
ncbi:MAG: hypothetical protein H6696_04500 [Deferribacteres bacterium]|nr:hypothetical protein [candidate division KSB1 bacterium]MCB9501176.1 hypothetical protein [Deferribacteres bacterium]